MVDAEVVGGLAGSLLAITTDSARIDALYQILGEYCHLFRNRLNSLKLSLYLARRPAADGLETRWCELDRKYLDIEHLVERLQMICRPIRLDLVTFALGSLLEERRPIWSEWMVRRNLGLELRRPEQPAVGQFDPHRLITALDALVEWRS